MSRHLMSFEKALNRSMKAVQEAAVGYRLSIDVAPLDLWLADRSARPTVLLTRCELTGLILDCVIAYNKKEEN